MRHSARSRRRGIRHHRDAGALKQVANTLFGNISEERDLRVVASFGHGGEITQRFGMICSGYDQLHLRYVAGNQLKGFDHRLQPFVCAPFSERQNSLHRVSALRKTGILRTSRQNPMAAHVYRTSPVFIADQCAVSGKQYGNRVTEQQQLGGNPTRDFVKKRETDPGILKVHCFHQLVQGDVGIKACHPRHGRNRDTCKRR
jgi:hypothetical protein